MSGDAEYRVMDRNKVVVVSGGFDPVHVGHIRLFKEAKALGNKLVVILNNDNWLMKKKGYVAEVYICKKIGA